MSLVKNKLAYILKRLDIHKRHRMNHSHLTQFIRQLAASLDEASIKVNIEFHRPLIVSLSKSLQFWTEVAAVSIWRVSHCHIKRRGKDVKEGHSIIDQGEAIGIAALTAPLVNLLAQDTQSLITEREEFCYLDLTEECYLLTWHQRFYLLLQSNKRAKLMGIA